MDWKQRQRRFLSLLLALFVGTVCVIVLLVKTLRKGPKLWARKERSRPPDVMNPEYGIHRHLQLKGIQLHYVECRSRGKPLMLFLHGFPEFWYSWRHQIKAFKNDYWTVAVDMRGYGESEKPRDVQAYDKDLLVEDVYNFIQALGHQSCVLVAHDWGGLVALLLVNRHPEAVDRLVLVNTSHPAAFEAHISRSISQLYKSWYMFLFQLPFFPEVYFWADDFSSLYKGCKVIKSVISQREVDAFRWNLSTRDKWTGPINYYRRFDLEDEEIRAMRWRKIPVPTLIVWGSEDQYLDEKLAELSAAYFVNCQVKRVEGAGHFVHQMAPQVVNRHVDAFLKSKRPV